MDPEYIPWYSAGSDLLRCQTCAALLVSGDTELHTAWHRSLT